MVIISIKMELHVSYLWNAASINGKIPEHSKNDRLNPTEKDIIKFSIFSWKNQIFGKKVISCG